MHNMAKLDKNEFIKAYMMLFGASYGQAKKRFYEINDGWKAIYIEEYKRRARELYYEEI